MTSSSTSARARAARTVDELVAIEWDPEELFASRGSGDGSAVAPSAAEQDELVEAIAQANAKRESELVAAAEQRVADAYAKGFEEGRLEGEAAEEARLRNAVAAAEAAIDALRSGEMRWIGAIEENVCALAVAVARQLIGRELETDATVVTELVRRAIDEFPIDQPLRVRVSSQDIALIRTQGVEPGSGAAEREARWIADPMIEPGGCLVEGRERIVDGRVDTALERLYRRLSHTHA